MEEKIQTIIQNNYEVLRNSIEPKPLADYLFKENTITKSQYDSILEKKGKEEAIEECLNILKNSRLAFNSFINFLKLDDARGFILEKLEEESESARGDNTGEPKQESESARGDNMDNTGEPKQESESARGDNTGEPKQDKVEEIRAVMFGKTGVGKSLLGNNILGAKVFRSVTAAQSVTKEANRGERMIDKNSKLVLFDTPGLFDTETNDNMETAKILTKTVREIQPGPHVFIFVLSISNRYTKEENSAIEFLKDLFGNSVTEYLIIVLTGKDNIDREEKDFDTYVGEAQEDLKNLLSQCRGYIAINNWASKEEITGSINSLLLNIKDVYQKNDKKYYTDALLAEAEKTFAEKLRLQEEEARKRERELEEEMNNLEEEKKKVEEEKKKVEEEARERETKLEEEKKKVVEESRERETKLEVEKKKVEEEARERETKLEEEKKKVAEEARERETKLEQEKKRVEVESRERETKLEGEKKKVEAEARERERKLAEDKKKVEEEARERERELEQEQMHQQSKIEALQNDTEKTQMKYEAAKKQTEELRIRQQEANSKERKAQQEKYDLLQKQLEANNKSFDIKLKDQDKLIQHLRSENSDLRTDKARKEGLITKLESELRNQETRMKEAKVYFKKELASNKEISDREQRRLREECDNKCSIQ